MTAPMRILALCRWFPPAVGGVETYLENLYNAMPTANVRLLAPGGSAAESYDQAFAPKRRPTVSIARTKGLLPSERKRVLAEFLPAAWTQNRRAQYDFIHCGHIALIPVAKLISRPGQRVGAFAYGSEFTRGGWGRSRTRAYNNVDDVFSISTVTSGQLLDRGVDGARISLVTPGVHTRAYETAGALRRSERQRLGFAPDDVVLISVGRLHPNARHKGFDTSIMMAAELKARGGVLTRLMIVGDGPDRARLEAMVDDLDVRDRVTFAGRLTDDQLVAAYGAADIYVMPSRQEAVSGGVTVEGFGIVFVEAAAAGLPVFATRVGGAIDAVAADVTGILSTESSPAGLAEALMPLVNDPTLRSSMGERGRLRASSEFEWSSIGTSFEARLAQRRAGL